MKNGMHNDDTTVVVGGGLAGLTAATYLARAGRPVTVLERSSAPGGRAVTNDLGGFLFNLGPHALYKAGAGMKVLRELGIEFRGKTPPLSGYGLLDGALRPISLLSLTSSLLPGAAKIEAVRVFASIARSDWRRFEDVTLSDWLDERVSRPRVRALVEALVRVSTYANDPLRMSASVALMQLKLAIRGVLYLDGGWQTLVDGLRHAAERAGARIVTGAPVERVVAGAPHCIAMKDGSAIEASSVIIAGSPDLAAMLLDSPELRAHGESSVPVRAACLDLGLRRLPQPKRTFALGLDRPYYFSVHSRTAKLAPDGMHTAVVAKYLPSDERLDARSLEQELEAFVDLVQPGWQEEVAERRFLPEMAVVNALPTPRRGGFSGRRAVDAPGVPGVYLAGDWVGGEGWLSDASFASGKRAAELALQAAPGMAPQIPEVAVR